MDTESIRLEVNVSATSQDPSLGLLSTVKITVERGYFEEFNIEKNDDHHSIKSVGSYRDSPPGPDSEFILNLRTFEPKDVYRTLHSQLHDNLLSEYIADEIVVQALRQRSQSSNLAPQPLFMTGTIKLTQKVYNVVPCYSAPSATNLESTCAICLDDLDLSRTEVYCQMPHYSHCYHEYCFNKWRDRHNQQDCSCPLCRKLVDERI
ncbi:PREDICTED: uncharacterized protein LOC104760879 [Camelina sativa]|uniref:Uncharacterized protein LOC104760879 n=1 Tax=Camelina sativa TaxID=90675 RepID=A0ABM0X893_CAMSA|nr:PREDICTED: uncharacterized protein LOC104760879 [Camelina sativa]